MEETYQGYRLRLMRSCSDGAELFSLIGPYLASPQVRRECGGYSLNDGPSYRWLIVQKTEDMALVGFLNFEVRKRVIALHHGYLNPEYRQLGIFRILLTTVLQLADSMDLPASTRVTATSAPCLQKLGFEIAGNRGKWLRLVRTVRNHGQLL